MARHPKIYWITESNEFLNNGHFFVSIFSFTFFQSYSWAGTLAGNTHWLGRKKNLLLSSWSWIYKKWYKSVFFHLSTVVCLLFKWEICAAYCKHWHILSYWSISYLDINLFVCSFFLFIHSSTTSVRVTVAILCIVWS